MVGRVVVVEARVLAEVLEVGVAEGGDWVHVEGGHHLVGLLVVQEGLLVRRVGSGYVPQRLGQTHSPRVAQRVTVLQSEVALSHLLHEERGDHLGRVPVLLSDEYFEVGFLEQTLEVLLHSLLLGEGGGYEGKADLV